ncbi:hypothetical protein L208DRAFT_1404845 [Tricholoma matsutake]|nr:hypothetical protein L208DRAFT_1404845 [Tricholoma matsutake 945]
MKRAIGAWLLKDFRAASRFICVISATSIDAQTVLSLSSHEGVPRQISIRWRPTELHDTVDRSRWIPRWILVGYIKKIKGGRPCLSPWRRALNSEII